MKVNQKRVVMGIVAVALLSAASLSGSNPISGPRLTVAATVVQASAPTMDINDVDAVLLDKGKQFLKQMSGEDVELKQGEVYANTGMLKLFTMVKDEEVAHVTMEKATGKINDFYVEIEISNLATALQEQLSKAFSELAPDRTITFDKGYRIGSADRYTTMLEAGAYQGSPNSYGEDTWVRFENDKLDAVSVTVNPSKIDLKSKNKARSSLLALGDKAAVFTKARRIKSYGTTVQDVYRLTYGKDAEVELGAITQRIYNVTVDTLRDAVLREELTKENAKAREATQKKISQMSKVKLLKSFTTLAQKIYASDTKGYTATLNPNFGEVKYTKAGSSTFIGQYNASGTLWSLSFSPADGKLN